MDEDDLDDAGDYLVEALRGLAPLPTMTVSEWADAHRILPDTSAEPGPWRTSRVPYLREPQDLLSATTGAQTVVVMKAAQLGFSEMLNNVIGYSIHQDPCPILLVQPTEATAVKYSKKRIAPMIEASPVLRALVAEDKSRTTSNTLLSKEFPGGGLTMVGSNAPSGLASLAVRRGLLDEVDRFSRDAGGEGDTIGLIRARLSTFINAQLAEVSTPTVAGDSLIAAAYEDSDQRVYEVPCPHCGAFQELLWKQVRWPADDPGAAVYHCSACDAAIEEHAKPRMLDLGEWVARNPGHPTAGFFISGLYSPWVSVKKIVAEFVAARGNAQKLQAWVNTRLGETWDPLDNDDVDETRLVAMRERYDGAHPPDEVVMVTLAVDVQDDRLEAEFCGWGIGKERWHLELVVINGDPSSPQPWADLDRLVARQFTTVGGRKLAVSVTLIDSGGHHTMAVYNYCRAREARRVFAIKGSSDPARSPLWSKRPSRTAKGGNVPIYILGVGVGKDACRAALHATLESRYPSNGDEPSESGPGLVHWPASSCYGKAYFEQLTAEQPQIRYVRGRPQRVWHLKKGRRNEAFDLDVYGLAALSAWESFGFRLEAVARQSVVAPTAKPPATAPSTRRMPTPWRR